MDLSRWFSLFDRRGATSRQTGQTKSRYAHLGCEVLEQRLSPSANTIAGSVYADYNHNDVRDASEPGAAGWLVYLDQNDNGQLDVSEASVLSDAQGKFAFTGRPAGSYVVREALDGSPSRPVTVTDGAPVPAVSFGEYRVPGYVGEVLSDQPAGYWRLGEASGTVAADASRQGRTATYSGAVRLQSDGSLPGDPDTSATFDGTGYLALNAAALPGSGVFTLEARLFPAATLANGAVLFRGVDNDGVTLYEISAHDGLLRFALGPSAALEAPLPVGSWSHVVTTYDGTTMRLFLNGVEAGTPVDAGSVPAVATSLYAGGAPGASAGWAGALDEVAVYDHALPPDRIASHCQAGTQRPGIYTFGGPSSEYSSAELDGAAQNLQQHAWARNLFRQDILGGSVNWYLGHSRDQLRAYISDKTPLISVPDPVTGASPWDNWSLTSDGQVLVSASSGKRYLFDPNDTSENWNVQAELHALRLFYAIQGPNADSVSRIEKAALAAVLTGRLEYGFGPATLIARLAETYKNYRLNEVNNNRWRSDPSDYYGKIDGWKKHDGDILSSALSAYGLLRDTPLFTDAQRSQIDTDLVQYVLDYYKQSYQTTGLLGAFGLQDHGSSWNAMGHAAAILGDQATLAQLFATYVALMNPANGFFGGDGTFTISQTPNYNRQFLFGLNDLGELLRSAGAGDVFTDSRTALLHQVYTWMLRTITPTGLIPAINDSHRPMTLPLEFLERGVVHWGDPQALTALQQAWGANLDGGNTYSLFFRPPQGFPGLTPAPFATQSEHLDGMGLMVLRDDHPGPGQTMLTLDYGGLEQVNHRQSDYLNLGLWSQGLDMLTELGYVTNPAWASSWQRSPLAHNTVIDTGFQAARGTALLWNQTPGVKIAEAGNLPRNDRAVALLDLGNGLTVAVDVFRVAEGGDAHTWAMHAGTGNLVVQNLNLQATTDVPWPLRSAQRATSDNLLHATWDFGNNKALDLFMLGAASSQVTTAQMPPEEEFYSGTSAKVQPTDLPGRGLLLVQRPGRSAVYTTVLVPSTGGSADLVVQPFALDSASPGTVALELDRGSSRWIVIHTGDARGVATAGNGLSLHGRMAVLHFEQGVLQSLVLSGGSALQYGTRTLTAGSGTGNAASWQLPPAYRDLALGANPVGYWRLGESSGSRAADATGHGYTGKYLGTPRLGQPGAVANDADTSVAFSGTSTDLVVPDSPALRPSALTVSALIRPALGLANWSTVLAKTTNWTDGYGLYYYGGRIWFCVAGTAARVSAPLQLDTWTQVVGTYDGAVIRLYLNGALAASQAYTGGLKHSTRDLRIGSTNGNYNWKGQLDETAVYDLALSSDQIASLFQATLIPPNPGTILGTVFEDVNGDRIQQPGENGLGNWTVFLDQNQNGTLDAGETSTPTDAQGNYRFDVPPVPYTLGIVTPDGWQRGGSLDGALTAFVPPGQTVGERLFAMYHPATLTGRVFLDRNENGAEDDDAASGLAGLVLYLDLNHNGQLDAGETTTTADDAGSYTFANIAPGTYDVRALLSSAWVPSAPLTGFSRTTVASGQTAVVAVLGVYAPRSQVSAVLQASPVAYWRFGDAALTGPAADTSTNALTASYDGSVAQIAGPAAGDPNPAAGFNGTSSRVVVADTPALRTRLVTVVLWLRPDQNVADYANVFTKTTDWTDGYGLYYLSGSLWWYVDGSGTGHKVSAPIVRGQWTHVAAVYDGFALRLYLNGQLAASLAYTGTFKPSSHPFTIGSNHVAYYWRGGIDEFSIYRDALNADQISLLYAPGQLSYVNEVLRYGLVGYWRLGETSGVRAVDASGRGRDGTYTASVSLGGAGAVAGDADTAAVFSGVGDVVVPNSPGLRPSSALSVMALIRPALGLANWSTVLAKTTNWTDGYGLYYYGGRIWFCVAGTAARVSAPLQLDTWTQVVGTYDGAVIRLYLNGVLAASQAYTGGLKHSTRDLRIGSTNGNYNWSGSLDEVAVFDQALPAERVRRLYTAQKGGTG